MSLLDPIQIPVLSRPEAEYEAATRPTGFGEYLGAKMREGFDFSIAGRITEALTSPSQRFGPLPENTSREDAAAMGSAVDNRRVTEDEWRKLRLDRPGLEFSGGGTVEYERARTQAFDERRYRESLIQRYQGGLAGQAAGFGAAILGGLPTPENFIPFVGPGMRAAMVARMGGIGGRAGVGALDAVIGTTIADAVVLPDLAMRGEDVGVADFALDLALGAVTGGILGAGAGVLARRADARFRQEQLATAARAVRIDGLERQADALEVAIRAVADDEPVDVGPILSGADAAIRRRALASTAIPSPLDAGGRVLPDDPIPGAEQTVGPSQDTSFLGAMRARGGIRRTSEIDADWKELQRAFPGIVSRKGMSVDEAVNIAINEGFLPEIEGVNYASRSDELMALIDEQLSGNRPVRLGEDATDRARLEDQARLDTSLIEVAKRELETDISGNELAIARQLVEEQDFDDVDALVQAMTYAALRNEGGAFDGGAAADDFDIPFDDVPGPARGGAGAGPAAGTRGDGAEGPGFGPAAADAAPARGPDAVRSFVADYVAREAERPPHPSVTEAATTVKRAAPKNGVEEAQRLLKDMGLEEPVELADIAIMKRDGLLTSADEAALLRADEVVQKADGWATAYETLASCVMRS